MGRSTVYAVSPLSNGRTGAELRRSCYVLAAGTAVLIVGLLVASPALAESPPTVTAPAAATSESEPVDGRLYGLTQVAPQARSYGWQNALAYLATDATIAAGSATMIAGISMGHREGAPAVSAGMTVLIIGTLARPLAGAAVHWAHEQWTAGGVSIGVNWGFLTAGGLLGGLVAAAEPWTGLTLGVGLGLVVPMAIDCAILAEEPSADGSTATSSIAVAPLLTKDSWGLSASGRF